MLIVLPTQAHVAQVLAARACEARKKVALGRIAVTLGELLRAVVDAALPSVRRLGALEERMLLRRASWRTTAMHPSKSVSSERTSAPFATG